MFTNNSEAVTRLTWEDVDFEKRVIRLFSRKRKGGKLEYNFIPMSDNLFSIMNRRAENRIGDSPNVFDFTPHQLKMMMSRLCKKAGVQKFGFHALRHLSASKINESGKVTIKQIQLLLRHKRQSTTEDYLHILEKGLPEAISLLDEVKEKVVRSGTLKTDENEDEGSFKNRKARL